jgi:aminoglycoside phosphotransferase (APT) family kinase protein
MTGHDHTYQGQHRFWHVLTDPLSDRRIKLAEPRDGVLWFDRRCFAAEEPLLAELAGLGMTRIPGVYEKGTGASEPLERRLLVQDFVEGTTLAEVSARGTSVTAAHLDDIEDRFRQLASVRAADVRTERTCTEHQRAKDGDTRTFLSTLIAFTHREGYRRHRGTYGPLFRALGVPRVPLAPRSPLVREAAHLTSRPFCLLHGDLHRANFIVAASDQRLWTIDWELAMLGDPVYDLATHLYLMQYPAAQEQEVQERWCRAVTSVLPGADAGWREDLPRYLAYKRAQSVFTDVVRHAQKLLSAGPAQRRVRLKETGETVHALLRRAADVLRPAHVPDPEDVATAYRTHVLGTAPDRPSRRTMPWSRPAARPGTR